jgi:hypothetical protein
MSFSLGEPMLEVALEAKGLVEKAFVVVHVLDDESDDNDEDIDDVVKVLVDVLARPDF